MLGFTRKVLICHFELVDHADQRALLDSVSRSVGRRGRESAICTRCCRGGVNNWRLIVECIVGEASTALDDKVGEEDHDVEEEEM